LVLYSAFGLGFNICQQSSKENILKMLLAATLILLSSVSTVALACKKYDTLIRGQYDNFLVGGKVSRITDHRFQKSTSKLDPLIAYIGFEELKVSGVIQPLQCIKIALVNIDSRLSTAEVFQLFDQFSNAMDKALKIGGHMSGSMYGHAFSLSSPFTIEK
jgi:hypothetical protein